MPMVDIYAAVGTFRDPHKLAIDAATVVKTVEQVPGIPIFSKNTAAFVQKLPPTSFANMQRESNDIRVQVLTNDGALDRSASIALVKSLTDLIVATAGDQMLAERTWALQRPRPGGLWGHAHTNDELIGVAQR